MQFKVRVGYGYDADPSSSTPHMILFMSPKAGKRPFSIVSEKFFLSDQKPLVSGVFVVFFAQQSERPIVGEN